MGELPTRDINGASLASYPSSNYEGEEKEPSWYPLLVHVLNHDDIPSFL